MLLKVWRDTLMPNDTLGEMYVDNVFGWHTLEDCDRDLHSGMTLDEITRIKIPKETAIPKGRYQVILDYSQRFKRIMPHICDVPGFAGVRIHKLNRAIETEGCIGIGKGRKEGAEDFITDSKDAFDELMARLTTVLGWHFDKDAGDYVPPAPGTSHEKVWIEIARNPNFSRRIMSVDELEPNPIAK